jgi:hypothetical protein
MAAERPIGFEELRARLSALEGTRKTAERELHSLRNYREPLERGRASLLETYAGLMPEAIDALRSEERYRVYKIIGMKAYLEADNLLELSGDVMSFSNLRNSSA